MKLKGFQMFTNCLCHLMVTNSYRQGVCHTVALPFTLKNTVREKKELWKLKYFTMQIIIFKKIL